MDFTIKQYYQILDSLQNAGFFFSTFGEYLSEPRNHLTTNQSKIIILRHDVDLLPYHNLRFAKIQAERGIKGSYYFRAVSESWNEEVIKEVADLGHEVGYHYENMDTALGRLKAQGSKFKVSGDNEHYNQLIDLAYEDFLENLENLRKLVEVKTICMHGSPRSKYDNKAIWEKYDYKELGLIGEPYYDMDFDDFFYLTDTGRRWDGWKVSVRDKVAQQDQWLNQGMVYHSTEDIISAINRNQIPSKIMFTFHPQRWHSSFGLWAKELVLQNAKNLVKGYLIKNK